MHLFVFLLQLACVFAMHTVWTVCSIYSTFFKKFLKILEFEKKIQTLKET